MNYGHPWEQTSNLGRANQRFGQSPEEVSRIGRLDKGECGSVASSLGCVVTEEWKEKNPRIESQISLALQTSPSVSIWGSTRQGCGWLDSSWADMLLGEYHSEWKG